MTNWMWSVIMVLVKYVLIQLGEDFTDLKLTEEDKNLLREAYIRSING